MQRRWGTILCPTINLQKCEASEKVCGAQKANEGNTFRCFCFRHTPRSLGTYARSHCVTAVPELNATLQNKWRFEILS